MEALLKHLSASRSQQASHSLSRLSQSTGLEPWRPRMQEGQLQQAAIRRSVSFRYPSTRQLRRTLCNRQPASAADLAALTTDRLETIARRFRDGNTSDWRHYWDFGEGKSPARPRHEELCRDSLQSDLRPGLELLGIDAQPEGRYADDKHAETWVTFREFNVPVEIKKSAHPRLWTSMRDQLVRKCTRRPRLRWLRSPFSPVVWRGSGDVPARWTRPRSARDLKHAPARSLTESERLKCPSL